MNSLSLHFAPLMPTYILIALLAIVFIFALFGMLKKARGVFLRVLSMALVILLLANPSVLHEEKEPVKNKVLIVVDDTASQKFDGRKEVSNKIVEGLKDKLTKLDSFEIVSLSVAGDDETKIWSSVEQAVSEMEEGTLSSVIMVTDGQIHDEPDHNLYRLLGNIPVHTILTGGKKEKDLSLVIEDAPSYGLVGETIKVSVKIESHGIENSDNKEYKLYITDNGNEVGNMSITLGKTYPFSFELDRAGDAVFRFFVEPVEGEISRANNTAVTVVKSVRDRLRVLLVSGRPHSGERTWRNMLKSDPAVDLVHFTILRSPRSVDMTPSRELSLIAFPVHELFQTKLDKFDLVIFDRYHMQGVLHNLYLRNVKKYVLNGGALLVAAGPEYSDKETSLYETPLKKILPAKPMFSKRGNILAGYTPKLTDLGHVHPVTEPFDNKKRKWGRWFRQVGVRVVSNDTDILMRGNDRLPLLMLSEVEKGRVAFLGSDQIWLWTRGFETGGPQRELLRRLVHWLMKEPDLEANRLSAKVIDKKIVVRRKALLNADDETEIEVTYPSGKIENIMLFREMKRRWQKTEIEANELGLYMFKDKETNQNTFAAIGKIDTKEMQQIVTTDANIRKYDKNLKGGVFWSNKAKNVPKLKIKSSFGFKSHGDDWLGIKKNNAYRVIGLKNYSMLSVYWFMILALVMVVAAWFKESRA